MTRRRAGYRDFQLERTTYGTAALLEHDAQRRDVARDELAVIVELAGRGLAAGVARPLARLDEHAVAAEVGCLALERGVELAGVAVGRVEVVDGDTGLGIVRVDLDGGDGARHE